MTRGNRRLPAGAGIPEREAAREYALRLLARPRTEHEVRAALSRRGFTPEVQEEVIGRLRELGLLDDLAYARAYIEESLCHRPLGKRALARRLAGRGVGGECLRQALAEVGEETFRGAAREAARAWLRRNRGRADARRLCAHLVRRGFEWDLAAEVAREMLGEEDDGEITGGG